MFLRVLRVLGVFKGWQTAGLDAHKKPLMCGLGVPVGCRMKHAKGMFKRCRLGAAVACAVRRSEQLLHSLQGFKGKRLRPGKRQAWTPITGCKGFEGLRAGKRQAWTPIRSH